MEKVIPLIHTYNKQRFLYSSPRSQNIARVPFSYRKIRLVSKICMPRFFQKQLWWLNTSRKTRGTASWREVRAYRPEVHFAIVCSWHLAARRWQKTAPRLSSGVLLSNDSACWDITFADRNFTARERGGKRRLRLKNSFYAGKFVAAARAKQLMLIFVDFHKIAASKNDRDCDFHANARKVC